MHKAKILRDVLGFHYQNWDKLSDRIYNAVQTSPVTRMAKTAYGSKYEIPVDIKGEKDRSLVLRTVWQVDNDSQIPRLITIVFDEKARGKNDA